MDSYLSVSEMASIHNISRRTLIYYDKVGVFVPAKRAANGYRYYSVYQIPFLREIVYLRSIGIGLNEIKDYLDNQDIATAVTLLEFQESRIDEEIAKLKQVRQSVHARLEAYSRAVIGQDALSQPFVQEYPERYAVFMPFRGEMTRKNLHLSTMAAWKILQNNGILPSHGFGTILTVENGEIRGHGTYMALPEERAIEHAHLFPAGTYVCSYKYGMPFDTSDLERLLAWIERNGLDVTGDIIDACLLDTTFYEGENRTDLCLLQVPVQERGK